MTKFFNKTGSCRPSDHYMLAAMSRLEEFDLERLITQKAYFVLHAPRQTGKTTAMQEWARQLTAAGNYIGVLVSMEVGTPFHDNVGMAEDAILESWQESICYQLPPDLHPRCWKTSAPMGHRIGSFLTAWALHVSRPIVALLDEVDALQDQVLVSVLRQLRAGFERRPDAFPSSIVIGLRDIRDYKVKSGGSRYLHTSSPFNIADSSLVLRNFTGAEVSALLGQHTTETGQVFTRTAQDQTFFLTQGQPWLVNALAKICVEELVPDISMAIDQHHIVKAQEILIRRRQTHLDQLADKLREPRIKSVIEPILAGGTLEDVPQDDLDYALDLGLIQHMNGSSVAISNPLYGEVIPHMLASSTQASLPSASPTWLNPDGTLNPGLLLDSFLAFWRQHGQPLLKSAPYHEIAPQLVMMAYLHRVVNSAGRIEREYAIGSRRIDLCLHHGGVQMAMELKVWRDHESDPKQQGLNQLDRYLSGLDLATGWLVIFDQRSGLPDISERTTTEIATSPAGRKVTVIRA